MNLQSKEMIYFNIKIIMVCTSPLQDGGSMEMPAGTNEAASQQTHLGLSIQ